MEYLFSEIKKSFRIEKKDMISTDYKRYIIKTSKEFDDLHNDKIISK